MKTCIRKWWPVLLALAVLAVPALGGTIKVWGTEALRYADLNSNFSHIHNAMVGGHGARLVDADVSGSALIAHSKMANPGVIPKAVAFVSGVCSSNPCTITWQRPATYFTSINWSATGSYSFTLSAARPNTAFSVVVTPHLGDRNCGGGVSDLSSGVFTCRDLGTPSAIDSSFTILIYDDDN